MKILLACLMCLVLTAAECFALKGGPDYSRLRPKAPSTYSGAFFPILAVGETEPDNSVALFTVTLTRGQGTGTVMVFREGNNYIGTMSATVDPGTGNFVGTVAASFTRQRTTVSTVAIPAPPQEFEGDCEVTVSVDTRAGVATTTAICNYIYNANGRTFDVRIIRGPSRTSQPATARLEGSARIDYRSQDPNASEEESTGSIEYSVVGYRQ